MFTLESFLNKDWKTHDSTPFTCAKIMNVSIAIHTQTNQILWLKYVTIDIVVYLDFHSTKRALWSVDSFSRASD